MCRPLPRNVGRFTDRDQSFPCARSARRGPGSGLGAELEAQVAQSPPKVEPQMPSISLARQLEEPQPRGAATIIRTFGGIIAVSDCDRPNSSLFLLT
eukprot:3203051-Amphidinium_carterae.1